MYAWLKLHKKIRNWEHYKDSNTKSLFIHLLIIASEVDFEFKGKQYPSGTAMVEMTALAEELGLTYKQIRYSLDKLQSTNNIICTRLRYGLATFVVNYESYQLNDKSLKTPKNGNIVKNGKNHEQYEVTTKKEYGNPNGNLNNSGNKEPKPHSEEQFSKNGNPIVNLKNEVLNFTNNSSENTNNYNNEYVGVINPNFVGNLKNDDTQEPEPTTKDDDFDFGNPNGIGNDFGNLEQANEQVPELLSAKKNEFIGNDFGNLEGIVNYNIRENKKEEDKSIRSDENLKNSITPLKSKNKKIELLEKKGKKGRDWSFIDSILEIFSEEFALARKEDFVMTALYKNRKAVSDILEGYKRKNKEKGIIKNSEDTLFDFRNLFKMALSLTIEDDRWLYEHMSPATICSQLNVIKTISRTRNDKPRKRTPEQFDEDNRIGKAYFESEEYRERSRLFQERFKRDFGR